jgi:hypothetical protein
MSKRTSFTGSILLPGSTASNIASEIRIVPQITTERLVLYLQVGRLEDYIRWCTVALSSKNPLVKMGRVKGPLLAF